MPDLLLGIDVGTSACKVAAHTLDGVAVATATHAYPLRTPSPGHVEQDPDDWWDAVLAGLREVCAAVDAARVAAVGVAGQSWSCVPVDEAGAALAPTPIWMDTRAAALCAEAEAKVGADRVLAFAGNRLAPSFTTGKILWFAAHRPQVHARARWYLQSNAFVVHRLTGVATQDRSQAYGLHVIGTDGRYSTPMAAALGLDLGQLPPVVDCHTVVGTVLAEVAAATGLRPGTPVVAGGLDAACATLGAGVHRPGQVQEQGGQAGGMSIVVPRPTSDRRLILSPHVVPGAFLLQGGTAAGGASLRWVVDVAGAAELSTAGQAGVYATVSELAGTVRAGSDGVVFLPYLAGERSPLWDPAARGLLYGLTFGTTRAHLYRAVMEGVAYALRHNLEVAAEVGAHVGEMRAVGGSAASPVWTQIKADVTGATLAVPAVASATTLGAAILAGQGVGRYADAAEAVDRTVRIARVHRPDPASSAVYARGYALYRELYERLAPTMAHQAGLEEER